MHFPISYAMSGRYLILLRSKFNIKIIMASVARTSKNAHSDILNSKESGLLRDEATLLANCIGVCIVSDCRMRGTWKKEI